MFVVLLLRLFFFSEAFGHIQRSIVAVIVAGFSLFFRLSLFSLAMLAAMVVMVWYFNMHAW